MQNKSEMTEIASKTLGDSTSYAVYTDQYDTSLLNPMPRALARNENNISEENFDGFDVWHCYEATFLTDNGHPVSGILKIVYPSDTIMMVESKSMKLFLNSFDMCKMGRNVRTSIANYVSTIRHSISVCLDDPRVDVNFFRHGDILNKNVKLARNEFVFDANFFDICDHNEMEDINHVYQQDNQTLVYKNLEILPKNIHVMFESLRSRCRHTKQKDTGSAIVWLNKTTIETQSIYNQINSMRETNEFHEFCAERLFTSLDANTNNSVIVALLYTRRGSLDINPIRFSRDLPKDIYVEYIEKFVDSKILTVPTVIQ